MTCWYFLLESLNDRPKSSLTTLARSEIGESMVSLSTTLTPAGKLEPDLLVCLVEAIGKQRWEEIGQVSLLTKVGPSKGKALLTLSGFRSLVESSTPSFWKYFR